MHKAAYPGPFGANGRPSNDPYVAIDIHAIAVKLECSPELLFGLLYYHLDHKYRYRQEDGSLVPLFYLQVDGKRHAVNFPCLAAILAERNQEFRRYVLSLSISAFALGISIASLALNLMNSK